MAGLAGLRVESYDEEGSAALEGERELTEDPNKDGEPDGAAESRPEELRLVEALLFAASEPLDEKTLAQHLPEGVDVRAALKRLQVEYAPRGVNLVHIGNKWTFRTANDLAWLLTHEAV